MNLNYLIWGLMLFLIGIGVGCALGNRWIKVTYYWTQNKIRHLRGRHWSRRTQLKKSNSQT